MVCNNTEPINVFFLPNLSEIMPHTNPPMATPAKNIISDMLFKYFRSQSKLNSDMMVSPEILRNYLNKIFFIFYNYLKYSKWLMN